MSEILVSTSLGQLRGVQQDGLRIFRGIPYAEPLAGLGRVRRPVPVQSWSGVREAQAFGPAAPQEDIPMVGAGPIGDDCLSLNIWAPDGAAALPVMVWIHGGGFFAGSSAQLIYDASRLARENNVVVVTLNYRLGLLGFACWDDHPQLAADSNNGLRDQILALQWVRDHIADFGGDPGRVTLFGESAGGISIACLMASPLAQGLFARAIIQSGTDELILGRDAAREITRTFVEGTADVAALITGPFEPIIRAQRFRPQQAVARGPHEKPVMQYGMLALPVVGDDVLPEHPARAWAAGASAAIPLIIGTNADEWNLFYHMPQILGLGFDKPGSDAALAEEFEKALPGRSEKILSGYRALMPEASRDDLCCAFESDRTFDMATQRLLQARAGSSAATWCYRLHWYSPMLPMLRSCHAMDLPFVFGLADSSFGQFLTGGGEQAVQFSQQIRAAWTAFAHHGAPAAVGLPDWTAHDTERRATMMLGAESRVQHDPLRERRQLWADIS